MVRQLTAQSTLDNLRKEAKRWLKSLRAHDAGARARLERVLPHAPAAPTLRDVQLALAREHGCAGWTALRRELDRILLEAPATAREQTVRALLRASGEGDLGRVTELLDRHPDIINDRADLDGTSGLRTALHFALGQVDVVRVLLERGADPNIRDEGDDAMPLHFAAERGDLDVVRLLIEHDADPVGEGTHHELNVLGWAVCWDYVHNEEIAEYLLAHGAQHTIHTAVALGAVDVIRELVTRSPSVLEQRMDRTNRRRTPLHLAVVKQRRSAVETLLELGADTAALDAGDMSPLDQAALNGDTEIVDVLLEHGAQVRLPAAVALNRLDDIERLLHDDPDSLKPGSRYGTLIIRASEHSSGAVVERLIRAGAAVDARDDTATSIDQTEGYTALHAAAWHGNTDAIAVLLEHGASANVREKKYGGTPAGWAAYAGREAACRQILAADIDPFQAIDFDLIDRIPEIVQRSPWTLNRPFRDYVPWEPDDDWHPAPWHTPLVWAVVKDKPEAVRVLLEQGALATVAPDGSTLLQIAEQADHEQVAALLKQFERFDETHAGRVRLFVKNACPDHDIRGPWHHVMALNTAERLLRAHPEIAHDSFYTALICGDLDTVERTLAAQSVLARQKGGPQNREPLLYLTFARLTLPSVRDNAVAMAHLLLDHGADPNVYFMAGGSRYTPLVGAIGEGEEDRPAHPQRDALVRLLLERGAEPYDLQVIYNIHFRRNVLWFLKLVHARALELGRDADWRDPNWTMLDMGGYGCGARWHLHLALEAHDLELAEWVLAHGASPNAPPARDPRLPQSTLYAEAVKRGLSDLAELLLRYGAAPAPDAEADAEAKFVAACTRLDRAEVERLLREHPEYRRATAALFAAARQNRADVVSMLLDQGVSPDVEDATKQRALHIAAYEDAVDVGRLLIDRGAEIDAVEENYGNTPLAAAVHAAARGMIELLGPRSRDIWNVVFTGHVERLRELLAADPALARTSGSDGSTLLMWLPDDTARALAIVEVLLAYGADPNARNAAGRTAADYAIRRGLDDVAARLRRQDAGR